VKNPLAGIEVMAGVLRRKIPASPDAQTLLADIIKEAKMANAIVQEVLDFVRPIRLQRERTAIADAVQGAISLADGKARRGAVNVDVTLAGGLPLIQGDEHQLMQLFTNLLINAYEAMGGTGRITITGERTRLADGGDGRDAILIEVTDDGPGLMVSWLKSSLMTAASVASSESSTAVTVPRTVAPDGTATDPSDARTSLSTVAVNVSPTLLDSVPSSLLSLTCMVVPTGRLADVDGVAVGCGATSPVDSTVAVRAHADVASAAIVRAAIP
jgi:hypothetical protein